MTLALYPGPSRWFILHYPKHHGLKSVLSVWSSGTQKPPWVTCHMYTLNSKTKRNHLGVGENTQKAACAGLEPPRRCVCCCSCLTPTHNHVLLWAQAGQNHLSEAVEMIKVKATPHDLWSNVSTFILNCSTEICLAYNTQHVLQVLTTYVDAPETVTTVKVTVTSNMTLLTQTKAHAVMEEAPRTWGHCVILLPRG